MFRREQRQYSAATKPNPTDELFGVNLYACVTRVVR